MNNCHCITAMARHRCRHAQGLNECSPPTPEGGEKEDHPIIKTKEMVTTYLIHYIDTADRPRRFATNATSTKLAKEAAWEQIENISTLVSCENMQRELSAAEIDKLQNSIV